MQTIIQNSLIYSYSMPVIAEQLDPYEHRLLGHYLSLGINSDESLDDTAKACKMSVTKAREARESLAEQGFISCMPPTKSEAARGIATRITIEDRHADNVIYVANKAQPDLVVQDSKAQSNLAVLPIQGAEAQPDLAVLGEKLRENIEAQPDLAVLSPDARARVLDLILLSLKTKESKTLEVPGPKEQKIKDKRLKDLSSKDDDDETILLSQKAWMSAVCTTFRQKPGGFAARLVAYFKGESKDGKWKEFAIEHDAPITPAHVDAFGVYWRNMYSNASIPTKPETIRHHFEAFLGDLRCDVAVKQAQIRLLAQLKPPVERTNLASPEQIAEFMRQREETLKLVAEKLR